MRFGGCVGTRGSATLGSRRRSGNPIYRGVIRFHSKEFKGEHEALIDTEHACRRRRRFVNVQGAQLHALGAWTCTKSHDLGTSPLRRARHYVLLVPMRMHTTAHRLHFLVG
jgi:hypothetical protein